jgi:uncharacterized protein (DUF1800 family)
MSPSPLSSMAALLLLSACHAPAAYVATPSPARVPPTALAPEEQIAHVLNRLAYGPSPQDVQAIHQLGLQAWIDGQLSPASIPDDAVEARVQSFRTLGMTTEQLVEAFPPPKQVAERMGIDLSQPGGKEELRDMLPRNERPLEIGLELFSAKLIRAVESRRQFAEVMTDFWFNHFNVSAEKGAVKWMLVSYERDAIRPHVFGRFRDLLGAVAHHPAMLFYLDNWMSVRDGFVRPRDQDGETPRGLNENYARELLELHTLGVDGGYTQQDVREVARAFTGWSIDRPRRGGGFAFHPRAHDPGPKQLLGRTLPGGGVDEGERVLDLLASHPSTARFIAGKLCRKLVSDHPPEALVARVADVFLRTGGDLRQVYAAIVSSPELWSAGVPGSMTKTPLELAASAIRAVGGRTDGGAPLYRAIERMGEAIYRAQPPTGYPEGSESWVNAGALVTRINFGLLLAQDHIPGTHVDVQRLLAPGQAEVVLDRLSGQLLGRKLSDETRRIILRAAAGEAMPDGETRPADPRALAGLLLGSPEFQKQ